MKYKINQHSAVWHEEGFGPSAARQSKRESKSNMIKKPLITQKTHFEKKKQMGDAAGR